MPPSQKAKIPLTPARGQSSNVLGRVCALCSRLRISEPGACSHSPLPAVCRRAIHDVVASVRTCLSEDMVAELTKCIRTNLDCADICTTTTGAVLSRRRHGYEGYGALNAPVRLAAQYRQRGEANKGPSR
jgi:hypothetical protein